MPSYRNINPRFGCTDTIYSYPSAEAFSDEMMSLIDIWAMEAVASGTRESATEAESALRDEFLEGVVEVDDEDEDYDLLDSETNDVLRLATAEEARESLSAGHEGHIYAVVDGQIRRCYVMAT